MPKGISVQEASARLTEAGIRLSDRYTRGASGKGGRWLTGASGAQANYDSGVQAAIAAKSYGKGVQGAGSTAYDTGVSTKGAANWPTGMQFAGPKYERKMQRFATLWNQPLTTPRAARRSPQNRQRMNENADRFQKAKTG